MRYGFWLICSLISLSVWGAKPFFSGVPDFTNLNKQVIFNQIFSQAPAPRVKKMVYVAREFPSGAKYSDYVIFLDQANQNMSQYHTKEVAFGAKGIKRDPNRSVVYGNGVGHGGIFSLAYLKRQFLKNKPTAIGFIKQYEITDFNQIHGALFPLHVGNKLSLTFTKRERFQRHGQMTKNHLQKEAFVYHVVRKFQGYRGSQHPIPGDIYVIRVTHANQNDSVFHPIFEYWYAEKLGWYIRTNYFKEGQLVVQYALVDWQ